MVRGDADGQGRCGVRVLDETSSGEHKFKLTALFLNQLGGKDMFGGWTAKNALFSKEEAAKREAKEAARRCDRGEGPARQLISTELGFSKHRLAFKR